MKINKLTEPEVSRRLRSTGICFRYGEFTACVTSPFEQVASAISTLYANHQLVESASYVDCHARVVPAKGFARWGKTPVRLIVNGATWYQAPRSLQTAALEWGLNWFVFRHAHHRLIVHAACLERNGVAMIMPAPPGSGKSTLTAALAHSGWRLLSDELSIFDLDTLELLPLARPICLKRNSIDTIKQFAPHAVFGPAGYDPRESRTIAHVRPPQESVSRMHERAQLRLVVFPRFEESTPASKARSVERPHAFMQVVKSSFNYDKLGRRGFDVLTQLIGQSECHEVVFGNLTKAIERINRLAASVPPHKPVGQVATCY